jgi:citrate lyase subunit beta/citryl-CoA lyase
MRKMRVSASSLEGARSWLFVPGDRADSLLEKAAASEADVLILDLEDSVDSSRKVEARACIKTSLARVRVPQPVVIRINALATSWWIDDATMAVDVGAAAVMLPKTGFATDVEQASEVIQQAQRGRVGSGEQPAIIPLVESAAGVLHAEANAAVSGVVAVALGGEDLAADLGVTQTEAGQELQWARGHLVLACAAACRDALDSPALDPRNLELTAAQADRARMLGFTGKLAIHPRQIAGINAAFRPREDETHWAQSVVEALDRAAASGSGLAVVDGRMVDAAVVAVAKRLIARSLRATRKA